MKLFIKDLNGKIVTLEVKPNDTIHRVKEKYHGVEGVLPNNLRLVYTGRQMDDKRTLTSYGIIKDGMTIIVVLRLICIL